MTNPKLQIPNKLQTSILNDQNDFVWDFGFWKLELIWRLVLAIWSFHPFNKSRLISAMGVGLNGRDHFESLPSAQVVQK
jgi:hypothetical protein